MEELFRDFWWLMFPMAWMLIAIINAARGETADARVLRDARENLERNP